MSVGEMLAMDNWGAVLGTGGGEGRGRRDI